MNIIENWFKKRDENTTYVIKISTGEYITKILSEQKLSFEFIDWDSVQSLDEFAGFKNPNIKYSPNDFLIKLNIDVLNELKDKQMIEFYKVDSYGWLYNKVHRNEIKLFNTTHPNKLNNLKEQNQTISADSFDQYRETFRPLKVNNILAGAMGLVYYCFKDDYDNFFRKIRWHDDEWILKKSELETFDKQILIQLLLFKNDKSIELKKSIFDGSKTLSIYSDMLENALEHFIYNDYSMNKFLQYMINEIKDPETKPIVDELKQLNDRYVRKGLSFDPKISHVKYIKEFIDLAKTDTSQLKTLLDGKELNKSAIFLLGMLNLGDRLDEQFGFGNFIPSLIALTVKHIIDINVKDKCIVISLDNSETQKNRNNKFTYIKEYFEELQLVNDLKDQIEELKAEAVTLQSDIETRKLENNAQSESDNPDVEEPKEEVSKNPDKSDDPAESKPKDKTGKTMNLF
jgi:hypothetical protein